MVRSIINSKPVAYYMQDAVPISPRVGGQVICKIVGHPRQDEFERAYQITSQILWVSADKNEWETQNTYYKPYRNSNEQR